MVPHEPAAVVHGHKIQNGEAKFKFISLLETWEEYNEDIHSAGAFLKWPEKATEKSIYSIGVFNTYNTDLLTESETSELSDEDQSDMIKSLPRIDNIDMLKTSQVRPPKAYQIR